MSFFVAKDLLVLKKARHIANRMALDLGYVMIYLNWAIQHNNKSLQPVVDQVTRLLDLITDEFTGIEPKDMSRYDKLTLGYGPHSWTYPDRRCTGVKKRWTITSAFDLHLVCSRGPENQSRPGLEELINETLRCGERLAPFAPSLMV